MSGDFRPQDGWTLVYGYVDALDARHAHTFAMPIAGWMCDEQGSWRPALVNLYDEESRHARVEFIEPFIEHVERKRGQIASELVATGTSVDRARERVHLRLVGE